MKRDTSWWRFFYDLFWIDRSKDSYMTWVAITTAPTEWNNFNCVPTPDNDNVTADA